MTKPLVPRPFQNLSTKWGRLVVALLPLGIFLLMESSVTQAQAMPSTLKT